MYVCIYVYMYTCIYVYMYTCIYVFMYTCIHVYTYICMYVCIYIYVYYWYCCLLGVSLGRARNMRPQRPKTASFRSRRAMQKSLAWASRGYENVGDQQNVNDKPKKRDAFFSNSQCLDIVEYLILHFGRVLRPCPYGCVFCMLETPKSNLLESLFGCLCLSPF